MACPVALFCGWLSVFWLGVALAATEKASEARMSFVFMTLFSISMFFVVWFIGLSLLMAVMCRKDVLSLSAGLGSGSRSWRIRREGCRLERQRKGKGWAE